VEIPTLSGSSDSVAFDSYFTEITINHLRKLSEIDRYFAIACDEPNFNKYLVSNRSFLDLKIAGLTDYLGKLGHYDRVVNARVSTPLNYQRMYYSDIFGNVITDLTTEELIWHYGVCVCQASEDYIYLLVDAYNNPKYVMSEADSAKVLKLISELDSQQLDFRSSFRIFLRKRQI